MTSCQGWQNIPKVELHLHLDPSLGFDVVKVLDPGVSEQEFERRFVGPDRCVDLAHFLQCIEPSLALLQSRESLELAVKSLVKRLRRDNVVYAEIRFAPLLHMRGGLMPEEILETVLASYRNALHEADMEGGVILCTLRHFTEAQSLATARLGARYCNDGVVGFDIAGDEAGFALTPHAGAFKIARNAGLGLTAHAGEALGARSVRETIELLEPQRIGHGVRSIEDNKVVELILEKQIHLETCPSSNVQIGVSPTYRAHPTPVLRNAGVSVGINTDTRTLCPVTLSLEYQRMSKTFGWSRNDFDAVNLDALRASFAHPEVKDRIARRLRADPILSDSRPQERT